MLLCKTNRAVYFCLVLSYCALHFWESADKLQIHFYREILGYGSSFVCRITDPSYLIRELSKWIRELMNTIRKLFNLIRALSNYAYRGSSLIDLKSCLIELKSSLIELKIIELKSSHWIWILKFSAHLVFHTNCNYKRVRHLQVQIINLTKSCISNFELC